MVFLQLERCGVSLLGLHGTYTLLWLIQQYIFADKRFAQPIPLWIGVLTPFLPLMAYMIGPYLLISEHTVPPTWVFALTPFLCISGQPSCSPDGSCTLSAICAGKTSRSPAILSSLLRKTGRGYSCLVGYGLYAATTRSVDFCSLARSGYTDYRKLEEESVGN